jgi:hypothetical protein
MLAAVLHNASAGHNERGRFYLAGNLATARLRGALDLRRKFHDGESLLPLRTVHMPELLGDGRLLATPTAAFWAIVLEIVKDGYYSLGDRVAQLMNKRPSQLASKDKGRLHEVCIVPVRSLA